MNLIQMYSAGSVKRWHTKVTIKEQDLAAHSWGVAMICSHLKPENNANLILAALTHDLHESELGDIPYHIKRGDKELKQLCDRQKYNFDRKQGFPELDEQDEQILKWADMFELLLWCRRERHLGNVSIERTVRVAIDALRALGPPNARASQLLAGTIDG